MLSNAYFLAKFRFDTAENEPAKNLQNLLIFINFPNFANPNPYLDGQTRVLLGALHDEEVRDARPDEPAHGALARAGAAGRVAVLEVGVEGVDNGLLVPSMFFLTFILTFGQEIFWPIVGKL